MTKFSEVHLPTASVADARFPTASVATCEDKNKGVVKLIIIDEEIFTYLSLGRSSFRAAALTCVPGVNWPALDSHCMIPAEGPSITTLARISYFELQRTFKLIDVLGKCDLEHEDFLQ